MAGSSDAGGMDVASEHIAEGGENDSKDVMMNIISDNFGVQQEKKGNKKVSELFQKISKRTVQKISKRMEVAEVKQELMYGKMLQRWEKEDPRMVEALRPWQVCLLQKAKDGTLKRRVDSAVNECNRLDYD